MQTFKEYPQYDATGLAQLVCDKEVTRKEILGAAINLAQVVNPKINAIINPLFKRAQQAADNLPQGAFSGVPFL